MAPLRGPTTHEACVRFLDLWWPCLDLNDLERRTFRRHLLAALLDGVYAGLLSITAYVLRKELQASALQIALLYSLQMSMFAFSSVGASFITRANHRHVMLVAGLLGRMSYLWIIVWHTPTSFIAIAAWVAVCHATYLPAQNMIFRTNYRRSTRGVCYARAQIVALASASSAAWLVGRFLQWNAELFPAAFAVAGLCGFGAYLTYRRMPNPALADEPRRTRRFPYADFLEILRTDRFFRRYELNFFIYGVAFMITEPLVPMLVNDVFRADWGTASRILGAIHPLVMIVFLPLYGRLLDRAGTVPVAAVAYVALAFWPFSLAVARSALGAYVAYAFFGLGMAGVDVAWMLGANAFAPRDRIQAYMAVHVTMVGVRAMIAPYLGLVLKEAVGFCAAFSCSTILLLTAAYLMLRLHRQCAGTLGGCREAEEDPRSGGSSGDEVAGGA